MEEIWKDIQDCEGFYQISNLGNILSLNYRNSNKCKVLKPFDNRGYDRITLHVGGKIKGYLVHRLVAEAFIPNPQNKPDVNHIDGNKKNNSANNLEWVTKSENTRHAIEMGLRPAVCVCERKKGSENPISKPIAQFDLQGNLISEYGCATEAEAVTGFGHSFIQRCCRGERKTYMNYKWKYI